MEFRLEYEFNVDAQTLYRAWLDSEQHSEMTGGEAVISTIEGEKFTAWDEYITGSNIELKPNTYIKQSWRSSQFLDDQPDSILELYFEDLESGRTRITLIHSNLTNSKEDKAYEKGWIENYFKPMSEYFTL
ncbi:MAG: SRPBCC domain-containing protein [Bacteroidota bacterium]